MIQLDLNRRKLLIDWFDSLLTKNGFIISSRGGGADANGSEHFTITTTNGLIIEATPTNDRPLLRFKASDRAQQSFVDNLVVEAKKRVDQNDLGEMWWYSATLLTCESQQPTVDYRFLLGAILSGIENQTTIKGWRILSSNILIEFINKLSEKEQTLGQKPQKSIAVHIQTQGPTQNYIAAETAHQIIEVVGSICTFSLKRGTILPPHVFPSSSKIIPQLDALSKDSTILRLVHNSISLDIFNYANSHVHIGHYERMRAAFLTFDAAVKETHDCVACILYVAAAESLCIPDTKWKKDNPTDRFIDFFSSLIPCKLDEIIEHGNFEQIFMKRTNRNTEEKRVKMRRKLLSKIYDFRSVYVHSGVKPSYSGITSGITSLSSIRRTLFGDFCEAAILGYLNSPRSSLVGHPLFQKESKRPKR